MSHCVTAFWITFAWVALWFWMEGVNRITGRMDNLERAFQAERKK